MNKSTNSRQVPTAVMLTERRKWAALLASALMLSACGGGGGGGTITPAGTPVVTFTSWNAAKPDSAVEAQGPGMQAPYRWSGTNISNIDPAQDVTASAVFMFDANGGLSRLLLTSGSTKMDFASAEMSSLAGDPDFVKAVNTANAAVVTRPTSTAWNYQSFGVWETGRSESSGNLGVISVGAPSPVEAIPGADSATFAGKVVGSYVSADGLGHTALADLNVYVNWADRSLGFSTTNTRIAADGVNFGPEVAALNLPKADATNPSLNTLTYAPGATSFIGTLTTSSTLSGEATGQFYGPNAEELGGVFFLNATSGVESYRGAYGAAQVTAP